MNILYQLAVAVSILVGSTLPAAADASACYNVHDADARAYCIAKAKRDPAFCYNIQASSLRSLCLAEVQRPK